MLRHLLIASLLATLTCACGHAESEDEESDEGALEQSTDAVATVNHAAAIAACAAAYKRAPRLEGNEAAEGTLLESFGQCLASANDSVTVAYSSSATNDRESMTERLRDIRSHGRALCGAVFAQPASRQAINCVASLEVLLGSVIGLYASPIDRRPQPIQLAAYDQRSCSKEVLTQFERARRARDGTAFDPANLGPVTECLKAEITRRQGSLVQALGASPDDLALDQARVRSLGQAVSQLTTSYEGLCPQLARFDEDDAERAAATRTASAGCIVDAHTLLSRFLPQLTPRLPP